MGVCDQVRVGARLKVERERPRTFLRRSEPQYAIEIFIFPEVSSIVQKLRPIDHAGQETRVWDIRVR